MIGISSIDQSSAMAVIINESAESTVRDAEARVAKYATLDGGSVIVHQGFSDGDRTLYVRGTVTEAEQTVLDALFQTQSLVHVATQAGCFLGAITRLKTDNGDLSMSISIESKLTA